MWWIERDASEAFAAIEGMDALADWLLGPGRRDFIGTDDEVAVPMLLHLTDPAAIGRLAQLAYLPDFVVKQDGQPVVRQSDCSYFTAFVPVRVLDELRQDEANARLRSASKQIVLGSPIGAAVLPSWSANSLPIAPTQAPDLDPLPPVGDPDQRVIMAVIDDGIAFANQRFCGADGSSRVQSFWQQDGAPNGPSVPYGRELVKKDIDQLLIDWTKAGAVDEPGLYRAAGLIDFTRPPEAPGGRMPHWAAAWRAAHGTHVLDLAAGRDPADDDGNRPIIAVQLPTAATADTSFRLLGPYILNAIDYIIDRAKRLASGRPIPVVINISYGFYAGPHDGTHPLEHAIDQCIQDSPLPLRVVLPAGNNHQSRGFARPRFTGPGCIETLPWRVPPDDRTPSFVQVWLPYAPATTPSAPDRLWLSLVPPGGPPSPWLGEQHGKTLLLTDGVAVLAMIIHIFVPAPTARGVFVVALQPTARLAPHPPEARPAMVGTWTILLQGCTLGPDDQVHAWIERDDTPYGYPQRGRQSWFDAPCYARFDPQGRPIDDDNHPAQAPCSVRRQRLVNALATGARTLVAGGFERRTRQAVPYSAGGPATMPANPGPDLVLARPDVLLVSDWSKVLRGVLAAGSISGSRVAFTGTSVAAPQLAAWAAEQLAQGGNADRPALLNPVVGSSPNASTPPVLPDDRRGVGRLERPPLTRVKR